MSPGRRTILVNRVGRRLHVLAPFGALALVKQIPGRRWDPRTKVWTLPSDVEDEAREILAGWPGGASWEGDPPATAAHKRTATSGRTSSGRVTTRCVACSEPLDDVDGFGLHTGCEARR